MNAVPSLHPVEACTPPAAYLGGKRQLAKQLSEIIATVPHQTYAEPFVGMGGVFFRRNFAPIGPKGEVINDRSGDVANLFRILQRHYPQFMDCLKFQITSRREFERLIATEPDTLTDLERAARFLYLQRLAFGGKIVGRTFGVSLHMPSRFDVTRLAPILEAVHERLAGVVIECLDWRRFIERYDRPETLFYLDPPYFGGEEDYGKGVFSRDDYCEIANMLVSLKGRFVLSINDRPETREIFRPFRFIETSVTYQIMGGAGQKARELIITDAG